MPEFLDTIPLITDNKNYIASNEYLLLMKSRDKKKLDDFLNDMDLTLLSPLEEWVHVGKNGSRQDIDFESFKAQENRLFLGKIKDHEAVLQASLNFIEGDNVLGCSKNKDYLYKFQWYLHEDTGINLEKAWGITSGNKKQVIAIVDRNFDIKECPSRQYYYENILEYFPQRKILSKDDQIHGHDVLSILAPCSDSLLGVDLKSQVFLVDSKDDKSLSARLFGLLWASGIDICKEGFFNCPLEMPFIKNRHEAQVINASFGFFGPYLKDPPYGPVLDVISHLNKNGKIIVASVGNEGSLADRRLPGSASGVISVAASTKEKKSALFNNYGRSIDVLAPGKDLLGLRGAEAVILNGTSFSAPLVSGVVSLLLSLNKNLSWKHVEYVLKTTATPILCDDYCPNGMKERQKCLDYCCPNGYLLCSSGIIDAFEALKAVNKKDFFATPLIDLDDYFITLSEEDGFEAKILVKNWGLEEGMASIMPTHKHLKIFPTSFRLSKAKSFIEPAYQEITLYFAKKPKKEIITSLILQVKSENKLDQIEAIVDVIPKKPLKPKKLKELYEARH